MNICHGRRVLVRTVPAVLVLPALGLLSAFALERDAPRAVTDSTSVSEATSSDPLKVRGAVLPPAFGQPRAAGEIRYPGATTRIHTALSASERAQARIDARHAEEVYLANELRRDLSSMPRSVVLARFSDDTFGPEDASGNPKPLFQDVLAWVVTVRNAPVVRYHNEPGQAPSKGKACDFVFVVDATTGDALTAFQACGREG